MKGTDYAEALPYVDKGRTAAAGASYGGYMVNWIAGHTDRFRALVSHDGIFDLRSMYGATEELWFVDWEFGGARLGEPGDLRARGARAASCRASRPRRSSIHGELDHRVPLEQGLAMFTALQRRGVPSRLLVFPDENHWVLKPANSVRWYQEVLGWLDRWTRAVSARAVSALDSRDAWRPRGGPRSYRDAASGLRAVIAIHDTTLGPGGGRHAHARLPLARRRRRSTRCASPAR